MAGMMHKAAASITLVLTVTALIGCVSATQGDAEFPSQWDFRPPKGWIAATPPSGPFGLPGQPNVLVWKPANAIGQMIAKQEIRTDAPAKTYADDALRVKLCHGLFGKLLKRPLHFAIVADGIEANENGDRVVVWYSYPKDQTPDPAAETALRSLCPRNPKS